MAEKLKSISCSPECGFMVRSHSEKEVLEVALDHHATAHPMMVVTESDLRAKLKEL